jgi:DNA repair protein RadC
MKRYQLPSYEVRVQRINETPSSMSVDHPQAALTFWNEVISQQIWYDPEREQCVSVLVNARLRGIGHSLVSIGSINEAVVHAREVYRAAVAFGAYGVVVLHNHPSGDPHPSGADEAITRRLRQAGDILQVRLLDHVIIGAEGRFYSFREAGVL